MDVPNAPHAVIPPEKLTGYLLALSHPVGGSKARFFRAHGFGEHNMDVFAAGLRAIVAGQAIAVRPGSFGTKYTVRGDLTTPRGTVVQVETVWIIEPHDERPRLVTAYPAPKRRPFV